MNDSLPPWIPLIGSLSILMFMAAIISLPFIIRSLPENVFIRTPHEKRTRQVLLHISLLFLRNSLGMVLLFMGFIMLFIPGQGILTMLVGLSLMTFPGKKILIHKILSMKTIQKGLNGMRRRMGKSPFLFP